MSILTVYPHTSLQNVFGLPGHHDEVCDDEVNGRP